MIQNNETSWRLRAADVNPGCPRMWARGGGKNVGLVVIGDPGSKHPECGEAGWPISFGAMSLVHGFCMEYGARPTDAVRHHLFPGNFGVCDRTVACMLRTRDRSSAGR